MRFCLGELCSKIEIVPLCYAPMHLMALIMLPRIVYYVRAMLEYVVTAYEISPVLFQHIILPFAHCCWVQFMVFHMHIGTAVWQKNVRVMT